MHNLLATWCLITQNWFVRVSNMQHLSPMRKAMNQGNNSVCWQIMMLHMYFGISRKHMYNIIHYVTMITIITHDFSPHDQRSRNITYISSMKSYTGQFWKKMSNMDDIEHFWNEATRVRLHAPWSGHLWTSRGWEDERIKSHGKRKNTLSEVLILCNLLI